MAVTAPDGSGMPQDTHAPEEGSVALPHLGQVIGGSMLWARRLPAA
jgi:hypothetical protein